MLSTPRVIFKCPHIKGGGGKAAAHLGNYVRYAATRDGVERVDPGKSMLPVTDKQAKLVEQLLRDFPSSRDLFEYEDYHAAPTRGNASEFITRAIEDNYEQVGRRENYVDYIASRPRVQKLGAHGLFTAGNDPLVLSQVADEVAHHPGVVWLPIISLRREDAVRLGYDNAERWRKLLCAHAMDMAKAMKIPDAQFRWYAAFHDEGHHPHIHMVCYSADAKSGFLTKRGIADIKSMLAKEIFQQDLVAIYQRQTQRRDELTRDAGEVMARLVTEMQTGTLESQHIGQLMIELAQRLQHCSGKKQYGYLPPAVKSLVDEVVIELENDPRITAAYDLWYREREEVLRTYKDDLPERIPLSRQNEFKRLKNIVIQEAVRLGEMARMVEAESPSGDPRQPHTQPSMPTAQSKAKAPSPGVVFNSTASLLYHMGRIFQEQRPQPVAGMQVTVDSKLKRKIREKKIAMGHKPDDHEEQGQTM